MIVNRRTGWRKQAYLTYYRGMDFLLAVHLTLEMGIYGMRMKSHMETNISYNASSQTTAQVLPPSARLGSIVSYGIRRAGSGKISASWEKSKNRSTPEHWRGMVFFPISRPTIVGHLTCSEEPCRSVVWILLRVGLLRKIAGKRGSVAIWLERLVGGTPVL